MGYESMAIFLDTSIWAWIVGFAGMMGLVGFVTESLISANAVSRIRSVYQATYDAVSARQLDRR